LAKKDLPTKLELQEQFKYITFCLQFKVQTKIFPFCPLVAADAQLFLSVACCAKNQPNLP
jgi:hypothetical protein